MEQALEQPTLVPIDRDGSTAGAVAARVGSARPLGVQEAWEMVTSQLQMEMKRALYESWVEPLQPVSFNEGIFRVGAVNSYAREWVEGHLRSRITGLLEGIYNQPLQLQVALARESAASLPAAPPVEKTNGNGKASGQKKAADDVARPADSPRKIQLQRAYGTERARVVQPERGMFLTLYLFNNWLPLIGQSAFTTILAARSLCYWNPLTGELRNTVETEMAEIARRAAVSVRTVKDVLQNEYVRRYFLRYKVRRVMTPNGVRTAGIILQVRMDDPLTPEDQEAHSLPEEERWYTADFEDEREE